MGEWGSVIAPITQAINVETIAPVLVAGVSAGVTLAFMWWGIRKVTRIIMAAFRKGRVSM